MKDEDGVYKYRVRAVDDALNYSDWTEWCYVKLDRTIEDAEEKEVLINEIMWSGSSEGESDEWIELYNDTTREIKLKNWEIVGAGSGGDSIILPASATIPSGGYYLIANYTDTDSDSELNVTVDFVTTALDLSDGGEDLELVDAFENIIDRAEASGGWPDGETDTEGETGKWKSMERNDIPGDGTDPNDWHTCEDAVCNDDTYWDTNNGSNYGTPGSENHSENDPTSKDEENKNEKDMEDLEIPETTPNPEDGAENEPPDILGATTESKPEPTIPEDTQDEEETLPPEVDEEEESEETPPSPEDSQAPEEESTEEEEETPENTEEEPPIIEEENTNE